MKEKSKSLKRESVKTLADIKDIDDLKAQLAQKDMQLVSMQDRITELQEILMDLLKALQVPNLFEIKNIVLSQGNLNDNNLLF